MASCKKKYSERKSMKRFYDLKQKQVTGWLEISRLFSWQIVWEYLALNLRVKMKKLHTTKRFDSCYQNCHLGRIVCWLHGNNKLHGNKLLSNRLHSSMTLSYSFLLNYLYNKDGQ